MTIKAELSANYCDRDKDLHGVGITDITFDPEEKKIWFNVIVGKQTDDYITLSFQIDELMECIGKALKAGLGE